jgi:preprotein translocase subunit SecG
LPFENFFTRSLFTTFLGFSKEFMLLGFQFGFVFGNFSKSKKTNQPSRNFLIPLFCIVSENRALVAWPKTKTFLEHYHARFLEVLVKQKLLGYFLILWGAYFVVAVIQDPFVDYAPSSGYLATAYTVVNTVFSLLFLVIAVVLVLLGRKVLEDKTDTSAKQKLLGYFLVLWGSMFLVIPIQEALRSHNYWGIAYTVASIILSLIFLAMALGLVFLGRKVLGNKTGISVKQNLLGYFLVLWGAGLFLNAILNVMPSGGYWKTVDFGYNLIAYPVFLATAVVLVLLGRKVLENKRET